MQRTTLSKDKLWLFEDLDAMSCTSVGAYTAKSKIAKKHSISPVNPKLYSPSTRSGARKNKNWQVSFFRFKNETEFTNLRLWNDFFHMLWIDSVKMCRSWLKFQMRFGFETKVLNLLLYLKNQIKIPSGIFLLVIDLLVFWTLETHNLVRDWFSKLKLRTILLQLCTRVFSIFSMTSRRKRFENLNFKTDCPGKQLSIPNLGVVY